MHAPADRPACRVRPHGMRRHAAAWALLGTVWAASAACSVARNPYLPTEDELRLRHEANVARVLHPPTVPESIATTVGHEFNLQLVLYVPVASAERVTIRRQYDYDQWNRLAERQRAAIVRIEQHYEAQVEDYLALRQRTQIRDQGPGELTVQRHRESDEQWERLAQRQRQTTSH